MFAHRRSATTKLSLPSASPVTSASSARLSLSPEGGERGEGVSLFLLPISVLFYFSLFPLCLFRSFNPTLPPACLRSPAGVRTVSLCLSLFQTRVLRACLPSNCYSQHSITGITFRCSSSVRSVFNDTLPDEQTNVRVVRDTQQLEGGKISRTRCVQSAIYATVDSRAVADVPPPRVPRANNVGDDHRYCRSYHRDRHRPPFSCRRARAANADEGCTEVPRPPDPNE